MTAISTFLQEIVISDLVTETSYETTVLQNLSLFPHRSFSPGPCHFPGLSLPCQAWLGVEETFE